MNLNHLMNEIPKWNTPLISFTSIGAVISSYLSELRSVKVLSNNLKWLINWLLSSPVQVGLTEFYCICKPFLFQVHTVVLP